MWLFTVPTKLYNSKEIETIKILQISSLKSIIIIIIIIIRVVLMNVS